jgi:hypothetical protein
MTDDIICMHFSLILFGSIIYEKASMYYTHIMFMGTIAHYEPRTTAKFIDVFLVHLLLQIHDILFVLFCFKNSFMTVTRIPKLFYFYVQNFRISIDIVCAYDFKV